MTGKHHQVVVYFKVLDVRACNSRSSLAIRHCFGAFNLKHEVKNLFSCHFNGFKGLNVVLHDGLVHSPDENGVLDVIDGFSVFILVLFDGQHLIRVHIRAFDICLLLEVHSLATLIVFGCFTKLTIPLFC